MAEPTQADEFVAVDIKSFRGATRDITFDVFLRLSETNLVHVFSKATGLDYKRLAQYIQKGVSALHIRKADQAAYERYVARPATAILADPSAPQEKKIATLLNITEQNISELFTQIEVSEESADGARKLMSNYVNIMAENPKSLAIILRLVSHGDYLYYHSIAVSIFSLFLAKATGQFNQRLLEIVGMGGFLHDIGCTQVSREILYSDQDLSPAQWKEMRMHTKLGLNMIENTPNVPDEVRFIVYQHHEEPSGRGYPNGLSGNSIYYPAKVVAVADAFSALISARPYRPAYSVEQAVQIIQAEVGKYDRDLVRILASIFLQSEAGQKAA